MNVTPETSPRVTTTTYAPTRKTIRVSMPDGWARAMLSGVEAAFVGWATCVLIVMGSFLTVASNPWVSKIGWDTVFASGSDVFGVLFGASVHTETVTYYAIPTLVSIGLVALLRLFLRGGEDFSPSSNWFAVPAFTLMTAFLIGSGASYVRWWEAMPGALFISLLASAWAFFSCGDHPLRRWGVPRLIRLGIREAAIAIAVIVGSAAVLTLIALLTHTSQIAGIHQLLLTTSPIEDALVGLGQLFFAPTILAWTLAWFAGPGFWVGVDALHSPTSAPTLPIPGIPVLGAMPNITPSYWTILVPIAIGLGIGIWRGRKRQQASLREQFVLSAVAFVVIGVGFWIWMAMSTLQLGATRMAFLGPHVGPTTAALLSEVGLAFVFGWVIVHPRSLKWMRDQWELSLLDAGQTAPPSTALVEESPSDVSALDVPPSTALVEAEETPEPDEIDTESTEEEPEVLVNKRADDTSEESRSEPELVPWTPTPQVVEPTVKSPAQQEAEQARSEDALATERLDLSSLSTGEQARLKEEAETERLDLNDFHSGEQARLEEDE